MLHKYILGLIFLGILTACGENPSTEQTVVHAATSQQKTDHGKIETGGIISKSIQSDILCTGKIHLPPTSIQLVHSKMEGQLMGMKYIPGDRVANGSLLAQIENAQLIEKQRMLLETKAQLAFAKKDYERKKVLHEANATPEKTFDESQNQFERLSATYHGLKTELQLYGVNVEQLESKGNYQSKVNIRAATFGVVNEVFVHNGQRIQPQDPIMEIARLDDLHLELNVLPKDMSGVALGQSVQFKIAGDTSLYEAVVAKIRPMIGEEETALMVHCDIKEAKKHSFIAGMFVEAIIAQDAKQVEGLPLAAVVKEGEQYYGFRQKNGEPLKTLLPNAKVMNDFVVFDGDKSGIWITAGAYYVE